MAKTRTVHRHQVAHLRLQMYEAIFSLMRPARLLT
jgi:hypothetical protein